MSSGTKKYKLFSAAGGGTAPCAFFSTKAGCRQGDACKFSHESVPDKSNPISEVGSVVSSESEPEAENRKAPTGKSPKKEVVSMEIDNDANPFISPGEREAPTSAKKKNRRGKRSDDHLPFANPKKKAKTTDTTKNVTPTPNPTPNQVPKKAATKAVPAFLNLDLPIASFSLPTTNEKKDKVKTEVKEEKEESSDKETNDSSRTLDTSKLPLPKSHPNGRKWLETVKATRRGRRYPGDYDFDKYRAIDNEAGICTPQGWIKAKPYGKWCADSPQSIAIDCEMCETTDPVSGKKNHKALCRISIVDAETKETLLDTLVKPEWPVTSYRTFVNGIKKEDLDNVHFTIRHAQAFMMALCSDETVIIGHALYNDLVAMRMEHHCNVDSACLFVASDSDRATVSLADLAKGILKKEMPNTHDSVNDAITALYCLEHYVEKDGNVDPVERTANRSKSRDPNAKGFEHYAAQLLVHRIPKMVDESHLSKLFLSHSNIQPTEVQPIEFGEGSQGKTHVVFQSPKHAQLAFEFLEGSKPEKDPSGRMQKKIFLRNKSYIKVRKMAYEHKREDNKQTRRASSG